MQAPPIHVLHVFGRMDRGGAEMRTLDLLPGMRERGVRFDFCAMRGGEGALNAAVRAQGSTVHVCELNGRKLGFARSFRRLMREAKPNIVHCHIHLTSGLLVTLARSAGVKHRVVHFRNTSDGRAASLPRRLYQGTMRRLIRMNATAILAVSKGAMAGGLGAGWPDDPRAQVIYNGINPDHFPAAAPDAAALRQELGLPDNAILVAQVGRLAPAKAHDLTLKAVKQITAADPRYNVLFIGDGERMPEIKQLAAELAVQDHVRFLGVREDVPRLLAQADLSILPSHWEGLPGAVLESLAARTRVVATDLPGVREIAAMGGDVTIIPTRDVDALAQAVLDAGPRPADASLTPALPDAFDIETCADQLYRVYAKLTGRDPAGALGPA